MVTGHLIHLLAVPSVLIVDDDPVIQLLLRVNFEMDGFEVLASDDGEQALAAIRQSPPDLVLLDVVMPKLNGFEVLAALKSDEATKSIPIALLSAKSSESDRQAGIDAGADLYITKPFDPIKLLAKVKPLVVSVADVPENVGDQDVDDKGVSTSN